ncbi:TIGR04255 family protein [Empedobacter stercoris]|uniref:TIGR04255 family protein n=1 Tax=Empedobacter stercoris TaxID=1628248 RepID=A0ABX1WLX8_9FLAO|nr:TIGR04255 family protein [Empedobacter stercoris]NOJ75697.1 TIGR04255 family protein [Empedobacter stercoris]
MFIPISKDHSISRVSANIFLPQSLIKPDTVFRNLNASNLLSNYQKKGVASSKTINLDNNGFQISTDEIAGFVFEEFNNIGKSVNVFKVENLNNKTKAQISFETQEYTRWHSFKERYFNDLESLIKVFNFYIEAISLNYVDEFTWNSNLKIPVESIFNTDAELLNSNFTNSHNGTLVIISQSERKADENFKEEKTEILFNNDIKRVIINHTYAIKLEDIKEYDKDLLETLFNEAHEKNKDLLNKILTQEIKDQINLSQQ